MCVMLCVYAWGQENGTETLDWSTFDTNSNGGNALQDRSYMLGKYFSVCMTKNSGSSAPGYVPSDKKAHLYVKPNSSEGNKITVSTNYNNVYITKVTFSGTHNQNNTTTHFTYSGTPTSSNTISADYSPQDRVSIMSATLCQTRGTSNGQFHCTSISVEYVKDGEDAVVLNISPVGYSTYYDSKYAYVMPEGVEGYVVYKSDDNWYLDRAYKPNETVPANVPLVIKGTSGEHLLRITTTSDTFTGENALKGTDTSTKLTANESKNFYALSLNDQNDPESIGFYWMEKDGAAFINGAHKAYLAVNKSDMSNANMRGFAFADMQESAITTVTTDDDADSGIAYNLCGQRVTPNTKGIVIIGNKKRFNWR